MKLNLPDALRALIDDAVKAAGAQLYDVEFNGPTLQVFIESESGVTVGLCRSVSEFASARLDQADLIPGRYYLEVSSPGLERRLRGVADFERVQGKYVHVVSSRGAWDGVIKSATADTVTLLAATPDGAEQEILIPLHEIKRANLKVRDEELFARKKSGAA